MDGLPPGITAANLSPDDIPEGFSAADPSGAGARSGPGVSKSQQQGAQIASVLDQCVSVLIHIYQYILRSRENSISKSPL